MLRKVLCSPAAYSTRCTDVYVLEEVVAFVLRGTYAISLLSFPLVRAASSVKARAIIDFRYVTGGLPDRVRRKRPRFPPSVCKEL